MKWDIPQKSPVMSAKITLDQAGRVSIPKTLRRELRLNPGDILQLDLHGDEITLRPVRPKALLKKERGLWVYQGEPSEQSIPDLIDRVREERARDLIG
jgi:AbrB family looped-hinge helix DNA binding protein